MIHASHLHTWVKAAFGKRVLKNDCHWHSILENVDIIIEYTRNGSQRPSIYMEKYISHSSITKFPTARRGIKVKCALLSHNQYNQPIISVADQTSG